MGKAFENQIKTIEDQGEKQKQLKIRSKLKQSKNILMMMGILYLFNEPVDERLKKIIDLDERINSSDLIYRYKGSNDDVNFDKFNNALDIIDKIRDGKIDLADVKHNQEKFKSYLGETKKGKKSKEQINTLYNIEMLYNARKEATKFYDDYSSMMSEARFKAETKGTGLKILTPKQMLQRLPIALAQVKAGNNSESLLNEIRKIVYSLYQLKQITKKLYNHIIESIQ